MTMAAATTFSPPETLLFNIGSTESAAAIAVKLAKKVKRQRIPIKRSFWNSVRVQAAKAVTRKSVLARSSVLRQGKFAEARFRTVAGCFSQATK